MVEDSLIERDRHDGDTEACLLRPELLSNVVPTPTVSMRGYDRALFCVLGGEANDATATLTITVLQSDQADAMGVVKPLAGLYGFKEIGPVVATEDCEDLNQKWLIEVSTEEMDVDAGFDWLMLVISVSAEDTWMIAVEVQRSGAAYEPVATTNITGMIGTTA